MARGKKAYKRHKKKRKKNHWRFIFECAGDCLCGSYSVGLAFEMKDYLEYSENKGFWATWKDKPTSCLTTQSYVL